MSQIMLIKKKSPPVLLEWKTDDLRHLSVESKLPLPLQTADE